MTAQLIDGNALARRIRAEVSGRTQALKGAYKTGAGRTSPWRIPPAAIDYYQQHQPRE